MKKISTLLCMLLALCALPLSTQAEVVNTTFDFENNPENWPVGEGANFRDGDLTAPLTVGEVTLTGIQGDASQPCRLMRPNDGISALYTYAKGAFRLNAADGRALTKVTVTMKSGTFDLTPSTGTVADNVWTGNATEVTFNHNNTGNRQILKIVITTDDVNSETVVPAAPTYDIEAANIAALNSAEDGKVVRLTLNNARVNAYNSLSACYYIEDASGATVVRNTTLTPGTLLNGYITGTKTTDTSIDFMNDPPAAVEYALTANDDADFTATDTSLSGTTMTIREACTQATYGRLVTLLDVSIKGGGQNKTITDADGNTMKARDYLGVLPADYTWPEKAQKITGVVIYYMTGWYIMPISAEAIEQTSSTQDNLFDFANNNLGLTVGQGGASDPVETQNAGNLAGKALVQGDVTMTFVNPATMPVRYFYLPSRTTNHLQLAVKDSKLRVTAGEGRAITKITVEQNVLSTKPGDNNVKWEVDKGDGTWDVDSKTWTGNATSVRFSATAATYINAITVTTAPADGETVTPAPDEYTAEVSSLAEFKALPDGTLAKLNLTDAIVTNVMINQWGCFVQDATAGAHFYCTELDLKEGDVLNGFVYVKKNNQNMGPRIAMAEDTNADNLTITADGTYTPVEGDIETVNVDENINKVVSLTGVAVKGTKETEAVITDSKGNTLTINNPKNNAVPYVIKESLASIDYASATVVGILYGASATENKLYPLSITEEEVDGIQNIAAGTADHVTIYNAQGIRLNRLQKGLNIVNGKKVMVK